MQTGLLDVPLVVDEQGDLAMPLDTRYGIDGDPS